MEIVSGTTAVVPEITSTLVGAVIPVQFASPSMLSTTMTTDTISANDIPASQSNRIKTKLKKRNSMKANTSKTELTMDKLVAKLGEQGTVFKVTYGFMHMEHDDAELAAALFIASPIAKSIKAAKTKQDLYDKCWCFEYSKEPLFG